MSGSKVCSKCREEKDIEQFRIRRDSPNKIRRNECIGCLKLYARQDYKKNKERRDKYAKERQKKFPGITRNSKYKREYGISLKKYNKILRAQDFKCKICGRKEPTGTHKHLVVDHDHITGKVRGLLCGVCNAGIGFFKDRLDLIEKAREYLYENL